MPPEKLKLLALQKRASTQVRGGGWTGWAGQAFQARPGLPGPQLAASLAGLRRRHSPRELGSQWGHKTCKPPPQSDTA